MPLLVFLVLVISFGIYLVPVFLLRRKTYARAQDYYVTSGPTPPAVIKNSSIAYALRMAAFGPLVASGASGDLWPAIISSAFLGLGLYLIYRIRRPLLEFLGSALNGDRSITINEFVAERHGNDNRVRLLASGLTVFALTGLIVCDTIGLATIVKPMLSGHTGLFYLFVCAALVAMVSCTVISGNSGAMYSAQLQLGAIYLGLFGSTVFLLYLQMSSLRALSPHSTLAVTFVAVFCALLPFFRRSRYVDTNVIRDPDLDSAARAPLSARMLRTFQSTLNVIISVFAALVIVVAGMELSSQGLSTIVHDSTTALRAGTHVPLLGLVALILLPLFYQIVDLTNWQRIAAFEKDRDVSCEEPSQWSVAFKNFFRAYATEGPFAWLFLCAFGAVVAVSAGTPDGADLMQAFVVQLISQENSVAATALSLLLIGMFAMALSTMIPLFSASLCTIRYDMLPMVWPDLARTERRDVTQPKARRLAVAAGGVLCLVILAASYLIEERLSITFTSGKFLALVVAFACAQLSFVPLVLGPLIGRARDGFGTVKPEWALGILGCSAAAGVGAIAIYLATGNEPWLWAATPACLGTGVVLFAVARLATAKAT